MKATSKQIEKLNARFENGKTFTCPSCKSNGGQHPHIENPGEDYTQIYCSYCREFINL